MHRAAQAAVIPTGGGVLCRRSGGTPAFSFPQKPQQIRLSSPSTPQNPLNQHQLNHFPNKNSWHSSYAPLATINIWIKSIEGSFDRAEINFRRPLAPLFLNRISHTESIFYPQLA
jgi:hypothetical protein